jgi:hypothetical protein
MKRENKLLLAIVLVCLAVLSISCKSTRYPSSALNCQVWMPSYFGEKNPRTIAFIDSIHKQDSIMGIYPYNKLK